MKSASLFEIIAARCWNLFNEGKPFTPIFVVITFLLYNLPEFKSTVFWTAAGLGLLAVLPVILIYICFDFPLFLRNYLWIPLCAYLMIWNNVNISLALMAVGLYFFFTVFFWGTLYYHLRIGTSWLNFTRFWKLVLKNSDSTSGNAQEQVPKFLLLLFIWDSQRISIQGGIPFLQLEWPRLLIFYTSLFVFSWILHRYLFDWRPEKTNGYTRDMGVPAGALCEKVVVMIVDGARRDRFQEAATPFLDKLREKGTEYCRMETVYPARTVVCFSSIFTGTYPEEHGIKSNLVLRMGVRVESIFDSLRKVGKKGKLLGIAHLIDAFGEDVDSVTAVMDNRVADKNIITRAKALMEKENPDLLVVQMIATDQTGHSRGALYEEYRRKIEEADKLIEEFFGWLDKKGMMKDTTVIICADHGQSDGIGGHGHLDEGERYVPFIIHGPAIKSGLRVEAKHSLVSVAPTIAHLLGAPYPDHSRGPVLLDAIEVNNK